MEYQHGFLPSGYTDGDDTDITLQNYFHFLNSVDRVLFERKNIILPRQANIFTTNYDEFFEVAASLLPSLVLNDGCNRRTGTLGFEYAPEIFFDRIYRSGTVYQHQSEIPSVNLVKVHGSISWKREADEKITLGEPETVELTTIQKDNPQGVRDALVSSLV